MHVRRTLVLTGVGLLLSACSAGPATEQPTTEYPTVSPPPVEELIADGRFKGEAWRTDLSKITEKPTGERSVSVGAGMVFLQDNRNMGHAVNLETGIHEWVVQVPGEIVCHPRVGGEGVTFLTEDRMVAVEIGRGARMSFGPSIPISNFPSSGATDASGSLFYGRAGPACVQSIDTDGDIGWVFPTSGTVHEVLTYGSGPLAQVIAACDDGLLFSLPPLSALGKRPKKENWFLRIPSARISTPVTLDDHKLYFGGTDEFLYCVNAGNGLIHWKTPCEGIPDGRPVVAGGDVYVSSSDGFQSIDTENGATRWTCTDSERLITRIGDTCYVQVGDVCSVRQASDGHAFSSFSIAGFAHVPSVPGGGVFVAGDGRGHLIALH